MFRLMAFALAVSGLCSGWSAGADVPDATTYLPDDTNIVLSIDVEQLLRGKPTKHLLGDKKAERFLVEVYEQWLKEKDSGEVAFAARLLSEAKRVTIAVKIFEASTVVFEGSYDAKQVLKDARALALANKLDVTTTKVGDHEVVRFGEVAFAVINKSQLVLSNSPPPGVEQRLFSGTPGRAEEVVKEAIARAGNKAKPQPNKSLAALLPKLPKKEPIAFLSVVSEPPSFGFVRVQGDDFLIRHETTYPTVEEARAAELELVANLKSSAEEAGNSPLLNECLKAAKIRQTEKTVSIEVAIPADVLKKLVAGLREVPKEEKK